MYFILPDISRLSFLKNKTLLIRFPHAPSSIRRRFCSRERVMGPPREEPLSGPPLSYPLLWNADLSFTSVHKGQLDLMFFDLTPGVSLCVPQVLVTQLCVTLCNSMECSPLGSSIHGIFQAKILEWVTIPFSRGSSLRRDRTQVSCIAGRLFTVWATREAPRCPLRWPSITFRQ